ncbi:MAG TPA: triose-phosphate isomerase, partial [Acidimicrobiales bacterium]|nr:triose-phosphate isomerase [Acidimicrobiales bacterium]
TGNAGSERRTLLVSGNWKMNENHFEALRLVQELAAILRPGGIPAGREASVHPPFTSLRSVQVALESDHLPLALGAQNCYPADRGAFTGEVSAEMLAKLDVRYVIAGHSERRRWFGETDEQVRAKLDAIWRHGMTPICCVGESEAERAAGEHVTVVDRQVRAVFSGRPAEVVASAVIAYEPVWAIGTGQTATSDDAQEMCAAIRAVIGELAGEGAAAGVRVQYGGSVNPGNAGELLARRDVDGLLVGGASLDAADFVSILRA